ncbi:hypothetical protein [Mycolicibacterium aubagnense]|uniref:DUF732 domain-containing protein n=1 Tax=Mycolicibacterium aubagnense TaxID=319707 RepID=A0ABM7IG85_9MYCO|nr:hypothetical protein [Mycolicibacterium aubagnense]TLH70426.1 hypothetical protein C1S80_00955 [Mycolicibacterium aubagnense]WGI32654.1 hypothetical protein QDT91_26445 [Mycolicibacterium aubagnense]BBX85731.1 hypothetical protein MAUB_36040 [Mycolicibacterium aubagnense]
MSYREIVTSRRFTSRQAAVLAAALLLAGCAGDKQPAQPTTSTSSAAASSTSAAPSAPAAEAPPSPTSRQLDGGTCLQLTGAVVNLMSGTSPDDAKAAGDTINGFHPPADVQAAVTHFVKTNGLHTSDPDRSQFSRTLNNWVEQQCPVQQPEKKPK